MSSKARGNMKASHNNGHVIFDDSFWSKFRDNVRNDGGKARESSSRVMVLKSMLDKKESISQNQVSSVSISEYANKDLTKAYELIRYFKLAEDGDLVTNSVLDKFHRRIKLLGAENWGSVMCYLDSLLFSMFAKLENFEPLLLSQDDYTLEGIKLIRLRAILRLYVGLLRSGKLITRDITRMLCESLYENGFKEAMSRKQEDGGQLFIFLTEILSMPLLTLKIDIAHGGAGEKDDHRYTKERMLYVSIPGEDDLQEVEEGERKKKEGEEAIEDHKPETETVLRDPFKSEEVESKPTEISSTENGLSENESIEHKSIKSTDYKLPEAKSTEHAEHESIKSTEPTPLERSESPKQQPILLEECLEEYFNNSIQVKRQLERRLSIRRNTITQHLSSLKEQVSGGLSDNHSFSDKQTNQHVECASPERSPEAIDESESSLGTVTYEDSKRLPKGRSYSITKDNGYNVTVRPRTDSTVSIWSDNKSKEVSLPAWMFLQLLPFYTDLEANSKTAQSFAEKRPILPICLKRYTFGKHSHKNNKKVIIPSFINLPDFIAEDDQNISKGESVLFRLVLESVVCHRGLTINSGHFISLVRDEVFDSNTTEEEEENKRWLLFDDLSESNRVRPVTFKEAFSKETPYILFYRMEPFTQSTFLTVPKVQNRKESKGEASVETPISTTEEADHRKSKDLLSKMVFSSSTYPYPNSNEYVDIKEKYYWKYKDVERGIYVQESFSDSDVSHSVASDNESVKSVYSMESAASVVSIPKRSGSIWKRKSKKIDKLLTPDVTPIVSESNAGTIEKLMLGQESVSRSRTVTNGKLSRSHKKNESKLRRQLYKDEKCTIV